MQSDTDTMICKGMQKSSFSQKVSSSISVSPLKKRSGFPEKVSSSISVFPNKFQVVSQVFHSSLKISISGCSPISKQEGVVQAKKRVCHLGNFFRRTLLNLDPFGRSFLRRSFCSWLICAPAAGPPSSWRGKEKFRSTSPGL